MKTFQTRITAFPYIWAWHKLTGSMDYYVMDLCEKAEKQNAPRDAIYFDGKRWHRAVELADDHHMLINMRQAITLHLGAGAL
jgi:hypothetical protein